RYQHIRVDDVELQRLFREQGCLEPDANGYEVIVADEGPPGPNAPKDCVVSQMLWYYENRIKIAEAHRYLRADGSVGASGKPDPKTVRIEDRLYLLRRT
ncbi:MAG TPA: hypothetical protein VMI13_06475, partial [Solirubrobacteraceae bacterium]|nr:hypothetical protein [Solirubrobacteraceae bacterium]